MFFVVFVGFARSFDSLLVAKHAELRPSIECVYTISFRVILYVNSQKFIDHRARVGFILGLTHSIFGGDSAFRSKLRLLRLEQLLCQMKQSKLKG